jgi:chaperonin GroES
MTKTKKDIKIVPLLDRVLLEEIELDETKTASGIILPQNTSGEGETKRGEVVAVGEGRVVDGNLQKPVVKEGDVVLYMWGEEIKVDGKKYILVGSDNITAIIK